MDKLTALKEFRTDLLARNSATKTLRLYDDQLSQFFDYCKGVPPKIDATQIREYMLYLKEEKNYKPSSQNVAISAIQNFYTRIMQLEWPLKIIGRPKVENKLPIILSQCEIKKVLSNITNLKHKVILSLMYSSGVRVSELLALMPEHIDSKQMYVMVRGGKGNKDRSTLLSTNCLNLLREYYRAYSPQKYLFNGWRESSPYSATSLANILKKAVRKAGINKRITLHTLRHSFATHLLENGVNIFYIKELLGHKSIKSTLVYLHLCNKDIKKIENPLDRLFGEGGL
jgi:site-specific recombinase XerD